MNNDPDFIPGSPLGGSRWLVAIHSSVTPEEREVLSRVIASGPGGVFDERAKRMQLAIEFAVTELGEAQGVVSVSLMDSTGTRRYPEMKNYLQGYLRARREFKGKAAVPEEPTPMFKNGQQFPTVLGRGPHPPDTESLELAEYARMFELFRLAEAYAAEVKDGVPEDPGPAECELLTYARRDTTDDADTAPSL